MLIKKRPKEERDEIIQRKLTKLDKYDLEDKDAVVLNSFQKYNIVCFFDTHDLRHCKLNVKGELEQLPYEEKRDSARGRMIKIQDDDKFNQGLLVLVDD